MKRYRELGKSGSRNSEKRSHPAEKRWTIKTRKKFG
jgi:hypothetical protein